MFGIIIDFALLKSIESLKNLDIDIKNSNNMRELIINLIYSY